MAVGFCSVDSHRILAVTWTDRGRGPIGTPDREGRGPMRRPLLLTWYVSSTENYGIYGLYIKGKPIVEVMVAYAHGSHSVSLVAEAGIELVML